MRLTLLEIEGYRSISEKVSLHIERNVTVLLGANDHGKTNILSALRHLNSDMPFNADTDLNWDRDKAPGDFPHISFNFELDEKEREKLLHAANESLTKSYSKKSQPPSPEVALKEAKPEKEATPTPSASSENQEQTNLSESESDSPPTLLTIDQIPRMLRIERRGVAGELQCSSSDVPNDIGKEFIEHLLPRVEIIQTQSTVPDEVGSSDLKSPTHEFMRGIFYYAGLTPDDNEALFGQADTTQMQLKVASKKLNETLKANWSQGKELTYELSHDAKNEHILLRILDPSVQSRVVRASRRSSGFTHFFALKTVLHARQKDHPANSYIFLFDEPGIYLHPLGQYDLLQMLDAIGKHNQVLYSTHSLFMINKTFPARHRLIVKANGGTRIDGKPFVGRWGRAIQELGYSLSGTILFAQHVLLAEGDSDPMLIQALFQRLMEWGKANIDLNSFSVISTGDSKNTDALIRMLKEGPEPPRLLVLFDGDKGGTERLNKLKNLLKSHGVAHYQLEADTTVEDHLPGVGKHYINAAAQYVSKIVEGGVATEGGEAEGGGAGRGEQVRTKFLEAAAKDGIDKKLTTGIADWIAEKSKQIAGLTDPSKVGIAREYIDALSTVSADQFDATQLKRPLALLAIIQEKLSIPELRDPDTKIFRD